MANESQSADSSHVALVMSMDNERVQAETAPRSVTDVLTGDSWNAMPIGLARRYIPDAHRPQLGSTLPT